MTIEEMLTALYEKFSAEQDNYRAWLLKQTPEEILNHSYEYTVREDIVMTMENIELCPECDFIVAPANMIEIMRI